MHKLQQLGYRIDPQQMAAVFAQFKRIAEQVDIVCDADLKTMMANFETGVA
jgi:2-isopropylmalate synthase